MTKGTTCTDEREWPADRGWGWYGEKADERDEGNRWDDTDERE